MACTVILGEGTGGTLAARLAGLGIRRPLLVAGRTSWTRSGAEAAIGSLLPEGIPAFRDIGGQPRIEDIRAGIRHLRRTDADCVLGVGGGTALDLAKSISLLAEQDGDPEDYATGARPLERPRSRSLVLVPTTAGTGSEVTPFAVVWIGTRKYSLDHPWVAADLAVVDPLLSRSQSRAVTASTGLDALSQAIESHWAVRSTPASRARAALALDLALRHIIPACAGADCRADHGADHGADHESRRGMSEAALMAGQAIAISRTTASHAVSYPLSALFGIPHGHACALTLPGMLVFNAGVTEGDVQDPRGVRFVRRRIDELLEALDAGSPEEGCGRLTALVASTGLPTRLSELGLQAEDLARIVDQGFNPDRVTNNPRRLTRQALQAILEGIL